MNFSTLASVILRIIAVTCALSGSLISSHASETATIPVGANVTLLASSDGFPAPTFQWRKNGVSIPNATGVEFSINNAAVSDTASYKVTASNELGYADSPDFVLDVSPANSPPSVPPAITLQPVAPSNAMSGGAVSFVVAASGTPTPSYQWFKNGVAMQGNTGATLTLVAIAENDSATYMAIASNVAGSVSSNSVGLIVLTPSNPGPNPPSPTTLPVITSQPVSYKNVLVGTEVTFVVEATGTPTPSIQWRKNGLLIGGATNSTLVLTATTSSDSATYVAYATNAVGSVSSNPSVLVVSTQPVVPPSPSPDPSPGTPPHGNGPPQAPTIINQPLPTQTVVAGAVARMVVSVSGSPVPTLQWRKNGTPIAGATTAALVFNEVTTSDASIYSVLAVNYFGVAVSDNTMLVVNSKPIFITQPATQAVAFGARATFSVVVSAIPGANLQWFRDGLALLGATKSVLAIDTTGSTDLGVYTVRATNAVGTATSSPVDLVIATPPVFTIQPVGQTVAARSDVTLFVAASGGPVPKYKWKKNGTSIPGATDAMLILKTVDKSFEGYYSVEASNSTGWAASNRALLVVNAVSGGVPGVDGPDDKIDPTLPEVPIGSRIINLSVRAAAGGANSTLIVGFVVNGTVPKSMLIRGVGPALGAFGVANALPDPTLSLYAGAIMSSSNDDWRTSNNALQIANTSLRLGAFGLPEDGFDAALLIALESGAYTVQISGKNSDSGVALVEVYDAAQNSPSNLVNLSVRTHVGAGADTPTLGFVISGNGPKRLVMRAVGPTLSAFGVSGVIADPKLELFRESVRIDQNDNWSGLDALTSVFERIGAFGFKDSGSRDAALAVTLDPGAYTVAVSGVGGSTGVALIEIYDVP